MVWNFSVGSAAEARLATYRTAVVTGNYFLDDAVPERLRALGAVIQYKPIWLEDLASLVQRVLKPEAAS